MTIHNVALNDRLTNFERCVECAPDGTFYEARQIAAFVADISNAVLNGLRDINLPANNGDALRDLEAALYGYIIASVQKEHPTIFIAAEAFGEHMDGPAGERVMAGIIRDRDFLRSIGKV